MSGKPVIAIFAQNTAQFLYLSDIARLAGAEPRSAQENTREAPILLTTESGYTKIHGQAVLHLGAEGLLDEETPRFAMPVKAAIIISHLEKILQRHSALPEKIEMGDAMLDTRENLWLREGVGPVRLTDRESEILIFLYKASGESVGRQDLLQHVWAYAPNVQTHTLETHIYRLRQKIEHDPSAPKILLTQEDGYSISVN